MPAGCELFQAAWIKGWEASHTHVPVVWLKYSMHICVDMEVCKPEMTL